MDSAQSKNATLLKLVLGGSTRRVKAALAAGANVNGSSAELPCTPIMAAAAKGNIDMVLFLIERGADPDRPAESGHICRGSGCGEIMPGELALHIAAKQGNVEIIRLLLERARANPNAIDKIGGTPLMVACTSRNSHVAAVVRLLLEAGADPALTEKDGHTALHIAARHDIIDVVDMLHAGAPATLSSYTTDRRTPLFAACSEGHETMASRLIALGAIQQMVPDEHSSLPVGVAVMKGYVGVVRLLIKEGMRALGNSKMFPNVLYTAVCSNQARILQLLLAANGEGVRSYWANASIDERQLLHHAAGEYCCPAAVSVLLAAGADEAVRDTEGLLPRDAIGVDVGQEVQMRRGKEVAIRRMLERGPAFRARSWAWPTGEADAEGCSEGDAVLSSAPVPKAPVGVRMFRPKSDRKFFERVVGRYCEKN